MQSLGFRGFAHLIVAGSMLLAGPARAEDEAPEQRAVYFGVEASPDAASQVAAMLALLPQPVALGAAPIHLDEVLPPGELTLLGDAEAAACTSEPVDGAYIQSMLDELYRATTELRETGSLIQSLRSAQPCLTEAAETAAMTRLAFLQGVIAFGDGDKDAASRAFEEVFAVDPAYPWDPEYPPDAQLGFANAATSMAQAPRVTLSIVAPEGAEFWLDGRPLAEATVEVVAGRHLIQTRAGADQPLTGQIATLAGDVDILVAWPELFAQEPFLLGGPATAAGAQHIVQLGSDPKMWSWDAATASLTELKLSPVARSVAMGRDRGNGERRPAGPAPVLVGVGAGMLVCGAIVTAVAGANMSEIRDGVNAGELPYAHPDDDDPTAEQSSNKLAFDQARNAMGLGVGFLAAGGATLAITIPIAAVGARKDRELSLSAAALTHSPVPGQPTIDGFQIGLSVR